MIYLQTIRQSNCPRKTRRALNEKHKNTINTKFLSFLFSVFSVFSVGLFFLLVSVGCSKSPVNLGKREQVIVNIDISEDMVWEGGKDYVV